MSNRSIMNRLYYAMFYAVLALLQDRRIGASKHAGVIALFDREFVKPGAFDRRLSKALHGAYELRQKGDYMENTVIRDEDIDEITIIAEEFVRFTESYLTQPHQ